MVNDDLTFALLNVISDVQRRGLLAPGSEVCAASSEVLGYGHCLTGEEGQVRRATDDPHHVEYLNELARAGPR